MKKQLNLILAEEVAIGILYRIHNHPNIPVYQSDLDALNLVSETFRRAHKRLKKLGEGGCDWLVCWIVGLGNKKLGIERDVSKLPVSVIKAITGGIPC